MNILLSAYHCAPGLGSESGVGWNYAKQLSRMNHKVTIVTSDTSKPFIERRNEHQALGIQILYYSLPQWTKRYYKVATISEHVYYTFWQIGLFFYCQRVFKGKKFDLIHHITLAALRVPSLLWLFKVPFAFGPVGGGEETPMKLLKDLKFSFKLKELFRKLINILFVLNPLYFCNLHFSKVILLRSSENLKYIPKYFHKKCKIDIGIGVPSDFADFERKQDYVKGKKFKILFAGRLLYWKGLHLAITAYSQLLENYPNIEFTIVGSGPEEEMLKALAAELKIQDQIKWVPKIEQQLLFQMYQDYDVFLFPSYHDSGGLVVVEAMSFGLPVVCLNLGGPKEIVNSSCGVVIDTFKKDELEVIGAIYSVMKALINDPERLELLKNNAAIRARNFSWEKVVQRSYGLILDSINQEYENSRRAVRSSGKIS